MVKKLDVWEEISGILQNFYHDKKNENLILEILFVNNVVIPFDEDFLKKLNESKGQKIGILRADLPEKPFILRYIK